MDAKFQIRKISLAITLVGIFLFTGCGGSSTLSLNMDGALPSVPGPESGRDSALNYVRDHHNIDLPFGTESWKGKNITPDGVTTSAAYEFSNAEWLVSVVYRVVEPDQRVYRVAISNHVDFSWEGQVDAFGQVAESLVDYSPSADQATSTPLPTVDQPLVISPTPTSASTVYLKQFRDETYLLGFEYPSSWSLTTTPAGRNTGVSFAAKTITLNRDGVNITLQYKFMWERTSVSGLLPPGDLEIRRRVKILDLEIPVKYVVENGVDKHIFLGGSKDELEFGISIDAEGEGIPTDIQGEADTIFASIVRTGDPLPTPTLAPTPLPTSAIAATRSGSGSGSVVSEDCNKASFVAHVTIPEGSLLLPGVQFTKVWRIQNVGMCTWTTAYHLVFSTGDLMGADKSVALPKDVPPGSSVDISVDFTTPEKIGDYQGYWILNDSQGFWFGLGEQKNGFIPIDIVVIQPNETFSYDFGIHYCDAIWKNKNH
ncbi:MAG: NBR1-Ig-like domain-containing protein, partial [Anaerolineales bacterium]|nr:NBR1-Ig-like domain-containing protein [Anaerolineales bacterium]